MNHEMSDHVIVCGLQGVGLRIVEQLHLSGTPVIVIDDDADARFARILEDWASRTCRGARTSVMPCLRPVWPGLSLWCVLR